MRIFQTKYQKTAEWLINNHPMRTYQWLDNRLFWKTPKGWLELRVGSSGTWYKVSEETTNLLNKENKNG